MRSSSFSFRLLAVATLATAPPAVQAQRSTAPPPSAVRSAPIANICYDVTIDSTTAAAGIIRVAMTFDVTAAGPVYESGAGTERHSPWNRRSLKVYCANA